mgnify:FL=1|jgi:H+/Cl- antiporter ClcA
MSTDRPPPIKTGIDNLIYKCNKYPKEYMMKLKTATPLILLGILIGLLGIYLISGICNDFDMSDVMTIESYIE